MSRAPGDPALAIDGTESDVGRALLALSALYWCRDWLAGFRIRVCNLAREDVILACQALHFDTKLRLELRPRGHGDGRAALEGASFYAAIACRTADHLFLDEARDLGIPTLIAIQFPNPQWASPAMLRHHDIAFEPRRFASALRTGVTAAVDAPP